MKNELSDLMEAASYDEFIINKLSIPDERRIYIIPDIAPSRDELMVFAAEKGVGIAAELSKKEIVEILLYEYGITNQEIKVAFRKYLGVEEAFFIDRYSVSHDVLEYLEDKKLLPVVYQICGRCTFLDAEFYFSKNKFDVAVRIYLQNNFKIV